MARAIADTARTRQAYTGPVSSGPGYQLVVFSREEIRAFDLPPVGDVTIGRNKANTKNNEDPTETRQHANKRQNKAKENEKLGGPNGTFIRQTVQAGTGSD